MEHGPAPQPAPDPAYPQRLECNERALLKKRPGYSDRQGPERVGFGLSGGGIRSATFCLGFFQALGRLGLLKDIDYLSSVSGGSYFASFYGRLFTRDDVTGINDVAGILAPNETEPANGGSDHWMRRVFRWLRENGRYLSPHGAGDLLLDLSVVLRDLLSVQLVMGIFVLMFLLAAQLIRVEFQRMATAEGWPQYYEVFYRNLPLRDYFLVESVHAVGARAVCIRRHSARMGLLAAEQSEGETDRRFLLLQFVAVGGADCDFRRCNLRRRS